MAPRRRPRKATRPYHSTKVWARWLSACGLPPRHIAIVLELDSATVAPVSIAGAARAMPGCRLTGFETEGRSQPPDPCSERP